MGGKTSTTSQKVQIPKEVMDRYNAVNTRAEGLADTPFKQYSTNPGDFVAPLNDQQKLGFSTINNAAGAYQPYFDTAALSFGEGMKSAQPGALNLDQFYNPYQQQVIDATMKQMGQANEQAQSGALGTAVSSGAFGGDRAGIAAANLANQQGLAMGSTLAGLNAQNYNQALAAAQQQQGLYLGATQADLERMMQGGQFYAGLGTAAQQAGLAGGEAQINAGTLEQQTEQAGKTAMYNQFQQAQAYPFQIAQFLANIAMGTGALSGSTTYTTQPSSFWSDRRLKHDIKRVGTADNGLPVYTFKYKGDDAEQTHVGYMADEVEKVHPEAVGLHPSGYKYVDYDRASRANGGGVAGPYGVQAGSQDPYVAGYVPQAYLPVGELITADPSLLQNAEASMAAQLEAASNFGNGLVSLKQNFGKDGDFWKSNAQRQAEEAARVKTDPASGEWRGGVVGYADGGAAYLGARGGLNPVDTRTYLSDTLDDQKKRDDELMRPSSMPDRQKTGFENMLDLGKTVLGFMQLKNGGRAGYALDGAVDDEAERLRRLREMEAGAATNLLPSGVVPQPDRLNAPVSYEPQKFDWKTTVSTATTPRAYEYDQATGLVRDSGTGQYITNSREAEPQPMGGVIVRQNFARNAAVDDINAQRDIDTQRLAGDARKAETMYQAAADAAKRQGSSQLPQYQFPDLYRRMMDSQSAAERAASEPALGSAAYVPPSEVAIDRRAEILRTADQRRQDNLRAQGLGSRLAANEPPVYPPSMTTGEGLRVADVANLMPPQRNAMVDRLRANEPPMSLSQGLIPAAGTPLAAYEMSPDDRPIPVPSRVRASGLIPAAGTPFPAATAVPAPTAPAASTDGLGEAARVTAPSKITPASAEAVTNPFGAALAFTLKHEGGFNPHDANGAPVNKGINGAYHPEVDIEHLTDAQAAEIYLRDYWRPINGDRIAAEHGPEMSTAVFDTAVMSGTDTALDLYRKSGGDLPTFLQLRANYLNDLAQNNPEKYAKYVKAWNSRNIALGGPSMMTGYGELGLQEPDRRGLGAGLLTPEKRYEDRTTLGKMFYDADGRVNKNALLSILGGIGAMASSPSRYLGSSILQGMGAAANTYAGLEKQAADIGLTDAQARHENIAADRERIYEGANGVMFINFGDGRPPVELWDYIENPEAYSTGNAALDAQIRREALAVAAKTPQPAGIFSDPSVQTLLDREKANSKRNPTAARAQSDAIESAAIASAAAARSSIPSILTQADAVSALTSPDAEVRAGALGPVKQTVTNYLNDISQTLSQITNTQLPVISDPNGGDAATNAQIILKEAVAAGMINASGIQELQTIMSAQPNVALTAEANSALMAGLLVSGRADMRRADFMRDYKAQPGNTFRTVIDAGQAFQEVYGDQILAEKAALKELIHYGSQPMPPEWAAILGDYKTPMEFLMTPGIPVEAKNKLIQKLLPYYGVDPLVVEALNGPNGMYIGNYFGG